MNPKSFQKKTFCWFNGCILCRKQYAFRNCSSNLYSFSKRLYIRVDEKNDIGGIKELVMSMLGNKIHDMEKWDAKRKWNYINRRTIWPKFVTKSFWWYSQKKLVWAKECRCWKRSAWLRANYPIHNVILRHYLLSTIVCIVYRYTVPPTSLLYTLIIKWRVTYGDSLDWLRLYMIKHCNIISELNINKLSAYIY